MTWVIVKTGPGVKENHVQFGPFARGETLATVGGETSWESRPGADRALEDYRARLEHEEAVAAGQLDLFGGGEE